MERISRFEEVWETVLKDTGRTVRELFEESKRLGLPPIEVLTQVWKVFDYYELAQKWSEYFSIPYRENFEYETHGGWFLLGKDGVAIWFPPYKEDVKNRFPDKEIFLVPYTLFRQKKEEEEGLWGLFMEIVRLARKLEVSDIHFEVRPYGVEVKFRILGELKPFKTLDLETGRKLQKVVKTEAANYTYNFDPERWQQRQDARIVLKEENLDLRLAFTPSLLDGMQNFVVRLLTKSSLRVRGEEDLRRLGYFEEDVKLLVEQSRKTYGLFVIGGPTGSGKSLTINTVLGLLDPSLKILTVEDPVEYVLENAVQHQVFELKLEDGSILKMDYLEYLREFMRMDPDVIFIGEWRKIPELTEGMLYASETGHLVFTTLHANRAVTVPNLLVNQYGLKNEDISNNLNFVLNQRLVKKLCPKCSTKKVLTEGDIFPLVEKLRFKDREKLLVLIGQEVSVPGRGCEFCIRTHPLEPEKVISAGFKGRTVLYEYLVFDEELRNLVLKTTSALRIEEAMVENSAYMFVDGRDDTDFEQKLHSAGGEIVVKNRYGALVKKERFGAKTFLDVLVEKVLKGEVYLYEAISKIL